MKIGYARVSTPDQNPALQNKGMFLEGIFRELLNISLTENNLQLLTVDLRAYLFSQVKLLYCKA